MSTRTFSIARSKIGEILVLDVATSNKGEFVASKLAHVLSKLIELGESQKVLLDMKGIKSMTSDVIGQLVMLIKKCKTSDTQLKLCGVVAENKLALDLVRLDQLVELYELKNKAVVDFKAGVLHPLIGQSSDEGSADQFETQAKGGNPEAQFLLAKCYESGNGVKQDFSAAVDWLKLAAVQEHVESRYALGLNYAYGIGASQDFDVAFDWFRQAADQGHAASQFWIGLSMQHGLVGEPDLKVAERWYREAAEQGHSEAHEAIAELRRMANCAAE